MCHGLVWKGGFRFLICCDRFATDVALDEIHRVLKEGAVLGMIWNIDDCKTVRSETRRWNQNLL